MKRIIIKYLLLVLFVSISSYSQSEMVSATYIYHLGDNDTRNDAKRIALLEAKRICIEKVGTYVEGKMSRKISESITKQFGKLKFKLNLSNRDVWSH